MAYPYEDLDIAQMRAEMLHKAQDPSYDDGAYLLSQNPDLLQVGLFGRGPKPVKPVAPVDLGRRRAFGLPETPMSMPATGESANAMVPVPQPVSPQQPATSTAPAQPLPQQPTPQQPSNPLGQMANKALNEPVSRRTVLKRAGSAALQQALPTPSAAEVVKEIASPLVESAAPAITGVAPGITMALKNLLSDFINSQFTEYADEDEIEDLESYLDDDTPGDKVLNALSGLTQYYDFLNSGGMADLVEDFRRQGASKAQVVNFLDQYFPGFDVGDADDMRLINETYAKPLERDE